VNTFLRVGTIIVLFALLSYSVATFQQVRLRLVTHTVLRFLWLGIILDVIATGCMILGASHGLMTFHGLLGYSALALMALDVYWITRFKCREGMEKRVSSRLQVYSIAAYAWWILAFVVGAVMAMGKFGR
jgi:hypothetical protein